MKTKQFLLTAAGIWALAFIIFVVGRWYQQEFSPIPEKRMWIDGLDVKGVATILSPKFTIVFEGVSWTEMSLIKSEYKVDGRYGGLFPPDSEPFPNDMGNGVKYEYSASKREMTITFDTHRFVYYDYLNILIADGKEYSTADAPLHLWVSRRGEIKQITAAWSSTPARSD